MRTQFLLIASDAELSHTLGLLAPSFRATVIDAPNGSALSRYFENAHPDLVVVGPGVRKPWDALHVARLVREWSRRVPVIIVTSHGSEDLAIAALRSGVTDYFKTPLDADELAAGLRRLFADRTPAALKANKAEGAPALVGDSLEAAAIRTAIEQIGPTESTVLITGETGSGKELVANLLHQRSRRSGQPLVSINCAAIPDTLVESELFGFERGSFTGADAAKAGRISAAHRGTVLFDEVGDMTPASQAKVLRLVEEKAITRLGSARATSVDARIIAATNQRLEGLMAEGRFRRDLYFRLNVARIHLPPLRDRASDIPALAAHYLAQAREHVGRAIESFTDEAIDALRSYDWPGNIREVKNVIERLVIHAAGPVITGPEVAATLGVAPPSRSDPSHDQETQILNALASAGGNKTDAARALGLSRMTLYRRLAEYSDPHKRGSGKTSH